MRCARSRLGNAQKLQGQRDVLLDGEVGQDVEGLKHETHAAAAQQGLRVIIHARQVGAFEPHVTGVGLIETGEQIEQRRLADARFAHDGEILAAP